MCKTTVVRRRDEGDGTEIYSFAILSLSITMRPTNAGCRDRNLLYVVLPHTAGLTYSAGEIRLEGSVVHHNLSDADLFMVPVLYGRQLASKRAHV